MALPSVDIVHFDFVCFRTVTYLSTLDDGDFYFLGENASIDVSTLWAVPVYCQVMSAVKQAGRETTVSRHVVR